MISPPFQKALPGFILRQAQEVGNLGIVCSGIKAATVVDPWGDAVGLIEEA